MKLSYSWLCDFVELDGLTPQEVAERLTMGAFEVEEVERVGVSITGPVVVGRIEEIHTHPNADKIRLTRTRIKEGDEPLQIVCGALNIEVGQKIPVALPGAVVLNRKTGEPLPIKQSEIRGVESNGMLCSPPELGITGGDSEGILILPANGDGELPLGKDLINHLGLTPDWVLHVEPRSNRGDALCVLGLAREVAALTGRPFRQSAFSIPEPGFKSGCQPFEIEIEDESLTDCGYFCVSRIEGLKVGPAPAWMTRRLESVGVRSINNIVDITNYVMLELGQPLHAYDMNRLAQPYLCARRARPGEKLEFIDGRERELSPEILVIADRDNVVGAAGIMGGKGSEITDDTTAIALEAACFNPARVRRGSRLLGLSSDSSVRFERGIDIAGVERAARRAIELVMKYGNVQGGGGFFQAGDDTPRNVSIELRLAQIERIAELDLDAGTCRDLLTPLGFDVEKEDPSQGTIRVKVPSFRLDDVSREIDLIEEVLRLKGYDSVPVSMPATTVSPPVNDSLPGRARRALAAQGLCEAWISSLRGESELEDADPRSVLRVLNPLSKDHQVLRQSLIPGLIEAAAFNFDHGNRDVWLFELGRGYVKSGSADESAGTTGVTEKDLVAGVITGSNIVQVTEGSQDDGSSPAMTEKVDFYRAKGIVENLFQDLGVPARRLRYFKPAEAPEIFHPYRACQVALAPPGDSKTRLEIPGLMILGWIGEIHPKILNKLGLRQQVGVFELNLDSVRQGAQKAQFAEPASTPSMTRDLTADLPREVDSQAVASCIESAAGQRLIDLQLVSVFHLSDGVRSLSYRMTFQDPKKTLTAEEIDKSINRIRNSLTHQLGANFRA